MGVTNYQELFAASKLILEQDSMTITNKLQAICNLLQENIAYYDWVGFYFAVPDARVLHLGPYAGPETDHKEIPFGKGICGQVAVSNKPFLVEDVSAQDNYIACSITVKSEIVVPLFVEGINVGQIDIDSNTINAFTSEDLSFLEELNKEIAKLYN